MSHRILMSDWKGLLGSSRAHSCTLLYYRETEAQGVLDTEQRPGRCSSLFKVTQPGLGQVFSPSTVSALPGPCDLSPAALPAVLKDRAHPRNPFLTALPFFESIHL